MGTEEFMKQQFCALRDEIRDSKSRIFWLLIIGIVLVMVSGYLAAEHPNAFANAAIPFLLLALMLSFISEQNNIARAGRYVREAVEPHSESLSRREVRACLRACNRSVFRCWPTLAS